MVAPIRQRTPSLRRRTGKPAPHFCVQLCLALFVGLAFCVYVGFMVTMALNSTTGDGNKTTPVTVPVSVDVRANNQVHIPADTAEKVHVPVADTPKHEQVQVTDTVLRAYLEPLDRSSWEVKPLPVRNSTAQRLHSIQYPRMQSCSKLPEQFPVDDYPDADPFLPWIHDVFPTHDGKFIQFVAQNKRRCRTGTTVQEELILRHTEPQVALFQHVAVKRVEGEEGDMRYQLTSHEEADEDGMTTRFICRFKPSMEETLSTFNVDYDWSSFRKHKAKTFTPEGRDNKNVHTSQLIFQCPVPPGLQETVRKGDSVQNDRASLFVDVIPIRTPPRYGRPDRFFPPRYSEFQNKDDPFDAEVEWGDHHILPRIEDSGRWENIPICKPSLMTYDPYKDSEVATALVEEPPKKHRLVACVWASAGYSTRGERYAINDGQRRLQEWINFNLLVGVDHFYVYDNSGAHNNETSLKPITDMFPNQVTRIPWPAKVCNNKPNNVDSPGERSSQYAAETSCRLRFGPYSDWIGGFDIDEYLVPMGNHTSLTALLDKLDEEGTKIFSFPSWRAWPRRALIDEPVDIGKKGDEYCGSHEHCFELTVPPNTTMLQAYNCERQPGAKTKVMPAEKQLYRADYVKLHFVHYSTITELSAMNRTETLDAGYKWRVRIGVDPKSRFTDEQNEASMLHTKAVARQDTADWLTHCKHNQGFCRLGTPYPPGAYEAGKTEDEEGWSYTCWLNEKVENYWVPRLQEKWDSSEKPWMS